MIKNFLISISIVCLVIVTSQNLVAQGVDLGISDDETYKRPNAWSKNIQVSSPVERILTGDSTGPASRPGVSIAWRNANQVEEIEVRVQNLGSQAGEGRVYVDITDETGKVLLHLEPPDELKTIRVPAFELGGREGKIIRMKASWELNTLIDRFDRERVRYNVRATVDTVGPDKNITDNSKVKSWNVGYGVRPGLMKVFNYIYKNHTTESVKVRWMFEHTPYPDGWEIKGVPTDKEPFLLNPGQEVRGTLTLLPPDKISEGVFLESRLSLVRDGDGSIFQQNEWFQVYDTEPPNVSNFRIVMTDDHRVAIQALVADKGSGVLEATGVRTEFSTDAGKTWATKAHNYKQGNFVRPTLFETVLGPFSPSTKVQLRFSAMDTAGNVQTIIPSDASMFLAPPNARLLLEQAYIFPRTQPNPIFDLEKLKALQLNLSKLKAAKMSIDSIDFTKPNILNIDPQRLKELKMDGERINDLKADLKRIADIDLNFNLLKNIPLTRLSNPAEKIVPISTLEVQVR